MLPVDQQVLSRHIINPNMVIHQCNLALDEETIISYDQFCSMIDYWKIVLVEKYNAKPGKKILIEFTALNVYYYSAVFAALELGLIMIIDWPHAFNETDVNSHRMTMHGKIDYAIVYSSQFDPDWPWYRPWDRERTIRNCEHIITEKDFDNYEIKDHSLFKEVAKKIYATPDMPAIWSASSGTTGLPKPIENSHRKIYLQAERLARLSNYRDNDSCLHSRNLHHGASMCYHFLPSFMIGRDQYLTTYFMTDEDNKKLSQIVNEKQINKVFLYTAKQVEDYLQATDPVNHHCDIVTLFSCSIDTIKLLREKNISSLTVTFGDTTIGLGFFVRTIDNNTDLSTYQKNCLGIKHDDFFEFEIRDGQLWIACPSLNEDWRTSNDRFELRDSQYYFLGRSNMYRINDEWISLAEVESELERLFGATGATISFDASGNETKILLIVWQDNPAAENEFNSWLQKKYNNNVSISKIARNLNYEEFIVSRKIDRQRIRDYFNHIN